MATRRQRRVADLIHEELGILLERKIEDPRLAQVTITAVEVTPDLLLATVFYSVLSDEEPARADARVGLERATGFMRRALAGVLGLRMVPDLQFRLDRSLAQGQRIETLLGTLHQGEERTPSEAEGDDEE